MKKIIILCVSLFIINTLYSINTNPYEFLAESEGITFTDLEKQTINYYSIHSFERYKNRNAKLSEKLKLRYLQGLAKIKYKSLKNNIDNIEIDSCDVIVMKNEEQLSVSVIQVTETDIRYLDCDSDKGPVKSIPLDQVFMIKYENGVSQIINAKNDPVKNELEEEEINPYDEKDKYDAYAIGFLLGFLLSIFGLFALVMFKTKEKRWAYFRG